MDAPSGATRQLANGQAGAGLWINQARIVCLHVRNQQMESARVPGQPVRFGSDGHTSHDLEGARINYQYAATAPGSSKYQPHRSVRTEDATTFRTVRQRS